MKEEKVTILLKKLRNTLTLEEEILFEKWLENSNKNKLLYEKLLQLKNEGQDAHIISELDINTSWKSVQNTILKQQKDVFIVFNYKNWFKYAAVFLALIGVSFFLKIQFFTPEKLIIKEEAITIQLENGDIEIISLSEKKLIKDKLGNAIGEHKGEVLDYTKLVNQSNSANNYYTDELIYNTLTIPFGKIYRLILSDGTEVHLNAGTSIKYPIKFIEGRHREVFLNGEAYFNVAEDKKHPFIVNTNTISVRALGTQFNVSSYKEDLSINTILVSGSVSVYQSDENYSFNDSLILKPNQKADWNKADEVMSVNFVDPSIYVGWIDGRIRFHKMKFKNIIKKLERNYNVTINNKNTRLDEEIFTATFDVESIEQIFESFSRSRNYNINYRIENNQIIIY